MFGKILTRKLYFSKAKFLKKNNVPRFKYHEWIDSQTLVRFLHRIIKFYEFLNALLIQLCSDGMFLSASPLPSRKKENSRSLISYEGGNTLS